MLSILNIYAHGYIAIPVIHTCIKGNVFKCLKKKSPVSADVIAEKLGANIGYLNLSLQALVSLNWVSQDKNQRYQLNDDAMIDAIPLSIMELYDFPFDQYLLGKVPEKNLKKWVDHLVHEWSNSPQTIFRLLEGTLLLPLLISLNKNMLWKQKEGLLRFAAPSSIASELTTIFCKLGWSQKNEQGISITSLGEQLLNRSNMMDIPFSYNPMLRNLKALVFGKSKNPLQTNEDLSESHVERTINVIASGFQHEKYFKDAEHRIMDIFGSKDFEDQPCYIAEMGCRDGTFLKRVYTIIRDQTPRGKVLDAYPLTLIGIDYNQAALSDTRKTLQGLPHITLQGNINDPLQLLFDLQKIGIRETDAILHIRSFLDHNRDYVPSSNKRCHPTAEYSGMYVDKERELISGRQLNENLMDHLEKWAPIVKKHGLLLLESHSLTPVYTHSFFEKTESFYFDTIHAFSGQYLVEAEKFLMAAAAVGLFPKIPPVNYPKMLAFSRITLNHFEKRQYTIKYAEENDVPDLLKLEHKCWDHHLRVSENEIRERLEKYPEGQLVLQLGNDVVGVIYSQRINKIDDLKSISFGDVPSLFDLKGSVVQLLAINILPENQHLNLGDQLLEFMLQRCGTISGIDTVVAVTRCRDYVRHQHMPLSDYVRMTNDQGRLSDPILRFHQVHGAQIVSLVPNYRLADNDNASYGILIRYDLRNRKRNEKFKEQSGSLKIPEALEHPPIGYFVVQAIQQLLGVSQKLDHARPLMEMGLDSSDLMELSEQIGSTYGLKLEAAFFFRHKTIREIISFLEKQLISGSNNLQANKEETRSSDREYFVKADISSKAHELASLPKDELNGSATNKRQDIAIIGVACRFPGMINSLGDLWDLLCNQRSAVGKLPKERWKWPFSQTVLERYPGIECGGFLEDIGYFDASFFRISPKEAELMDPQQRILLELSWHALEDAGYRPRDLFGQNIGVFIGASGSDYSRLFDDQLENVEAHFGTGTALSAIPNRVSYFFNFHGPSIQVDTACSSSLVALHQAVRALQGKECTQALVGGINIMCHPATTLAYYKAGMLARDGKCKSFDKSANGYVRSEGAAVILLKPLHQAISDRDHIHAVIRGTATCHGGQASGLTVPNPDSQTELLLKAYKEAEISCDRVGYIEAHGSGTALGDPIEVKGLKDAFSELVGKTDAETCLQEKPMCGLGSIKSNLGHLEAASGLAGLLKVVAALNHREIPATINFESLNPHIDLSNSPFYIVDSPRKWKASTNERRYAGVSNFGSGGTNAHAVLEEYVPKSSLESSIQPLSKSLFFLVFSAQTRDSLKAIIHQFHRHLRSCRSSFSSEIQAEKWLSRACYTMQIGRDAMLYRAAIFVNDIEELDSKLAAYVKGDTLIEDFFEGQVLDKNELEPHFDHGDDISEAVEKFLKKGKYDFILKLWVQGLSFDWKKLYKGEPPEKISLPGYVFAKERFWLPEKNRKSDETYVPLSDDLPALKTNYGNAMLAPIWHPASVDFTTMNPGRLDKTVLVGGTERQKHAIQELYPNKILKLDGYRTTDSFVEQLRLTGEFDHVVWIVPSYEPSNVVDEGIIKHQEEGLCSLFAVTKALIALGYSDKTIGLTIITEKAQAISNIDDLNPVHAGILGFVGTLSKEFPNWKLRVVDIDPKDDTPWTSVFKLPFDNDGHTLLYRNGVWYRQELIPVSANGSFDSAYKQRGVYVIIGGAGGVGMVWSEYMIRNYQANIIWIGRRKKDGIIESKIQRLGTLGPPPLYIEADATDQAALKHAYEVIKSEYPIIHGVVHSAVGSLDQSLINTTEVQFRKGLAAKLDIGVRIAQIFYEEPLDFIIFFSSIVSFSKDHGKCSYAAGSTFIDAFAHKLSNELPCVVKVINWGYWGEVGIGAIVPQAYKNRLKLSGIHPIESQPSMDALEILLDSGLNQMVFVKLENSFGLDGINPDKTYSIQHDRSQNTLPSVQSENDFSLLKDRSIAFLKKLLSKVLKISYDKIDSQEPLVTYGIDSILITQLTSLIRQYSIDVNTTVFFENRTTEALAEYMLRNHKEEVVKALGLNVTHSTNRIGRDAEVAPKEVIKRLDNRGMKRDGIAIIGMSGRYPMAKNLRQYWENLKAGKDCITEIPSERWSLEGFFEQNKKEAVASGKSYSKWGGFLEDFASFDPLFFNISPREAMGIDPQERLFTECCWEAIEDACYTKEQIAKKYNGQVGVFVGVTKTGFNLYGPSLWKQGEQVYPHTSFSSMANRISYFLNLQGPSMPVDTMCSSSLTAIHEACEHLLRGECEVAIAGGVNLYLHPSNYVELCALHMLMDGRECRSFGEGGGGFVPGEGVGAILLKPLHEAEKDGDHIYAVIRGTNINHGGKTNGYTIPNPTAQAALIRKTLQKGGVHARAISYVEAHGTGTSLGDPIEISGLTQAFQKDTSDIGYCSLGSVKSNIGHLESAAGIAGLTKVVLQMQHKLIVPSLHARVLNPHIPFERTPFIVQQELAEWHRPEVNVDTKTSESSRFAVVLSFGAGGSNACVVLEEYEPAGTPFKNIVGEEMVVVLSAKDKSALKNQAQLLLEFIESNNITNEDLPSVTFSLQIGREVMEERLAFIVQSKNELLEKLRLYTSGAQKYDIDDLYEGSIRDNTGLVRVLSKDDDVLPLMDSLIVKKKYRKLCELWVAGLHVDWEKLYVENVPKRLSLPTYPFARERYWIKDLIKQPKEEQAARLEVDGSFELMTFEECWKPIELPLDSQSIRTVLCFAGLEQEKILRQLHSFQEDLQVVFVSEGSDFVKDSTNRYRIDVNQHSHFENLLKEVKADSIWYLWPIENTRYQRDFLIPANLFRALHSTPVRPRTVLLAAPHSDSLDSCYSDTWVAFEKSLNLVMPDVSIAAIYDEELADVNLWISRLWHISRMGKPKSLLYRNGSPFYLCVQETHFMPGESLLRSNATYLITGGCGGLGKLFADYIARKVGPVNLILNGRSSINADIEAQLKKLTDLGCQAVYIQADISDPEQLKEALRIPREHFREIHGVFHAAGLQNKGTFINKDIESFENVLLPKVVGTQVLDQVLAQEPLEFVCYFSSSAAVLGDFGTCDYALANRFQITYAAYRSKRERKTVAICWPLWRDGGMKLADTDNSYLYLKSTGQRMLEADEGCRIFEKLISQPATHQLIIAGKREHALRYLKLEEPRLAVFDDSKVLNDLKDIISSLLLIPKEKIDREANFADLGFDSISLASFAHEISIHFSIAFDPAQFFVYSTLEALVNHLISLKLDQPKSFKRSSNAIIREVNQAKSQTVPEPIAIIGMSGRFPQARTVDELWQILAKGKDAVQEIPSDRFDWREYYGNAAEDPTKTNSKWQGCIPGVKEFDAHFFGISPREAKVIDPRQRLLMQEAWRALEDAGYGKKELKSSRIGVYIGVEQGDYQTLSKEINVTANHDGILASRLSYFLDLHGPVMAINTSCSSGLVAIHQACQSLRNNECDTALAGGVSLTLTPEMFVGMAQSGMLSDDGKCYTFDQRANGMVPAEAIACVVLKRLSNAQKDKDPTYALIRGSAINCDGKTNGITAPGGAAQSQVLRSVIDQYQIDPEKIEHIITHGTGTKLGDPVEANALIDAYKAYTKKTHYCALTSTKSNFGHSFAASGVVSLISLVESMVHRLIPSTLNCEQENPYIDWSDSPFYVNKTARHWTSENRWGAVSAFGMSGTNAHLVVESYNNTLIKSTVLPCYLLVFSAKSPSALQERISEMSHYLHTHSPDLLSVCYTLIAGRQHFEYRSAFMVTDISLASTALKGTPSYTGHVMRDFVSQKSIEATLGVQSIERQAELYCQGYDLDGEKLFGKYGPVKLHLPTYPFARDEYWVATKQQNRPLDCGDDGIRNNLNGVVHDKPKKISLSSPASGHSKKEEAIKPIGVQLELSKHVLSDIPATCPTPCDLKPISLSASDKNHTLYKENSLNETLATTLGEVLDLIPHEIDRDANFIALGLDSIIGVEWVRRLNKQLGLKLQATIVYSYPSINELGRYIERESNAMHDSSPRESSSATISEVVDYSGIKLQEEMRASLAELLDLKINDVNVNIPFIDLGLDSIISVEWIRELNKTYGVRLQATQIYDYPNIRVFSEFLAKNMNQSTQEQVDMAPTLREVLEKVQLGLLDIELADQLLKD